MRKIKFFFVHGWGFDGSFWLPITNLLKKKYSYPFFIFDIGFLGNEKLTTEIDEEFLNIFIVHSYGFNWILKKTYKTDLIINFSGSPIFVEKNRENLIFKKKLEKMIITFENKPKEVMREFYNRCGLDNNFTEKKQKGFNKKKMLIALNSLLNDDLRNIASNFKCPMLSIYLRGDKILNYRKFENYFFNTRHKYFLFLKNNNHAFPYLFPNNSLKIIEKYLDFFLGDFS